MNYTVVVLGGVLMSSLVWYYFPVYGGVHWFTGPVPNVGNGETGDGARKNPSVDGNADSIVDGKHVDV